MENIVAKRADGSIVKPGDKLIDFRGEEWEFTGITSKNLVYVFRNKNGDVQRREFYPSVFGLSFS